MFRCTDLEKYCKEIDPKKVNLLLVNKSDFLSDEQREAWAEHFNSIGVYAVFFSALIASQEFGSNLDTVSEDEEEEEGNIAQDNTKHGLTTPGEATSNIDTLQQDMENLGINSNCQKLTDDDDEDGFESANSSFSSAEASDSEEFSEQHHSSTRLQNSSNIAENNEQLTSNSSEKTEPLITTSKLHNREDLIEVMTRVAPPRRQYQQYSTIGLVGYPNVGKSSTINCLLQEKRVTVSATPGKTKHFQVI